MACSSNESLTQFGFLGNKKDNITVIYTPWANLKKDGSMDVGQVSFHDQRKVRRILVPNRENPIVNRLNKTKVEKKPDLKAEKDDMLKQLRAKEQAALQIKVSAQCFAKRLLPCSGYSFGDARMIVWLTNLPNGREKKNSDKLRSGKRRSGRKTMRTTIYSPRRTWPRQATKTGRRIGKTISCRFDDIHEDDIKRRLIKE